MLFRQSSSNSKEETTKLSITMVKLKNGSEVPKAALVTTMISLEALMKKNPIAFYELVEKARNPKHKMFGNTQDVVSNWALIDSSGVIHSSIKDIILSAVSGDELNMQLSNPVVWENEEKVKVTKKLEEKFAVSPRKNSIYYGLNNPKELKAIEISDDLYRAKFYFSEIKAEHEEGNYELTEERRRIRGLVSSAVHPPLPEIGHVAEDRECIEIYGMKDFLSMPKCNKDHISENYCIAEQLHPLEWILTKARNSGILPNELYERIRIDVRHRVVQLQEIAKTNQNSSQQIVDEVRKRYSPDASFKRITTSSDIHEFAGQIVAYVSDSYYFSNGDNAITLPLEASGHKIRFAKVGSHSIPWQGGNGYNMDCFLKPEACGFAHALIDSQIKSDASLAMRLATVQELEFLKLTLELDQGRLNFRAKKEDIQMLDEKIVQASKTYVIRESQPSISTPSFFTGRKGAGVPPFIPFTSGAVDWARENENKDKSVTPKPSKVYLVTGGDEESRREKAYNFGRQDGFAMYAVYHNKDKSEYAVVFSCDHDTFNLMNFDLAKKFAGQKRLPEDFSTSIFGCKDRFGIVSISDSPKSLFRAYL